MLERTGQMNDKKESPSASEPSLYSSLESHFVGKRPKKGIAFSLASSYTRATQPGTFP